MTVYSLPAQYYTDPVIYAKERERIFRSAWWLLGPQSNCAEPYHYLSDTVCGWPVFAIRDKHGELRAFHNICRHRGAELLSAGEGKCRVIQCPYHGWGYAVDGTLMGAPGFSDTGVDDAETLGLLPIRVAEWRGMVFVCIDADAPPFLEWIATLDRLIADFPGIDSMNYHGKFVVDGTANWKTYCDNTVEGYHLHTVHPRLADAVKKGRVEIVPYDNGELVAFHVNYADDGAELRGNLGLWAYRYPGFQIAISDNAFKAERVEATSISSTQSINWSWYRNLSATEIDDSFAWSETVVREDLGICESVQRNLVGGVYSQGPLSPLQESNVMLFQNLVRQAVD